MTCWFWRLLMDALPDAGGVLRRGLERHVSVCAGCRAYREAYRQIVRGLQAAASSAREQVLPAPAAATLRAVQSMPNSGCAPRSAGRHTAPWARGFATAALVLGGVLAAVWLGRGTAPVVPGNAAATTLTAVTAVPAPGLSEPARVGPATRSLLWGVSPLSLDALAAMPESALMQESQLLLADMRSAVSCLARELGSVADFAVVR